MMLSSYGCVLSLIIFLAMIVNIIVTKGKIFTNIKINVLIIPLSPLYLASLSCFSSRQSIDYCICSNWGYFMNHIYQPGYSSSFHRAELQGLWGGGGGCLGLIPSSAKPFHYIYMPIPPFLVW